MCWGHFRSKWQKLSSNWLTHNRECVVYVIGNPKVCPLQAQLDPGPCLQDVVSLCTSRLCFLLCLSCQAASLCSGEAPGLHHSFLAD